MSAFETGSTPFEILPPRPSVVARVARKIGVYTAATTLVCGVGAGASDIILGHPAALPLGLVTGAQELLTSCDETPAAEIDKFQERLNKKLILQRAGHAGNGPLPLVPQPSDYGLHSIDTDEVVQKMRASEDPENALAIADEFAEKRLGISIESPDAAAEKTRDEAVILVEAIGTIPLELQRAVTADDLDAIIINTPLSVGKGGRYGTAEEVIELAPNEAKQYGHELGHAFRRTVSRKTCTLPTTYSVPDFEAVNPPGFEYGDSKNRSPEGRNITVTEYAAEGVQEDYAETAQKVFNTDGINACLEPEMHTIKRKIAIFAADLDKVVPGSGEYYIDQAARHGYCE